MNEKFCTQIPERPMESPENPREYPFTPWLRGLEKGGMRPRSSRKMSGLPKGAFLENPVKRPDPIRGIYDARSARGGRNGVFKTWVNFPSGTVGKGNRGGPEKKSRQTLL